MKANVDRNTMRPGDTFTYTISISSEGATSFEKPQLPDLSAFEVLNSWSGSEMRGSFMNGQMRTMRSQKFNYMLSARKAGTYTIGAAEVVVNGQAMRTNPIQIEVSESAPQGPSLGQGSTEEEESPFPTPPGVGSLEEEMFSQLLKRRLRPGQRQGPSIDNVNEKDVFFIHVEVDKNKVYKGEQVTASWYLLSKAQIADIDTLKYPTLSGFWKEDIEIASRLNFQPQVINGMNYQRALLASYALFPINEGKAVIDQYRAKCRAILINSMGFPQDLLLTKDSEEISIDVLPLPKEGQPTTFTGGVGQYTLTASLDTASVKVNTPVTLKIRIEGAGNAKSLDLPALNLAPEIQVYDTKSNAKFFNTGRSYKEFETLLVPKAAGNFKVPPITIAFFDPAKKTYYTQTTSELTFQAQASAGDEVIPALRMKDDHVVAPVEKKAVLPGALTTFESPHGLSVTQQAALWGGLYSLTFLGLFLFGYKSVRVEVKRKDLKKLVNERVAELEKHLTKGDWRRVGREATNLIYFVLGEVASLGGASFEFDRMVDKAPPSFKRQIAPRLRDVMAKAEAVGFAPEDLARRWSDKSELKKLLKEIEMLLLEAAKYDFTSVEKETN